jgi:hypothetical protein
MPNSTCFHEAPYRPAPDAFTANGLLSEPNPEKRPKAIHKCGLAVEGGGAGRCECRPLVLTGCAAYRKHFLC